MITITTVVTLCGLLIVCHYFLYPKSGPYITYQIPDRYFFTWIYVTTGILFMVPAIGMTTLICIMCNAGILFVFNVRPIYTSELRLGVDSWKYFTLNKLRHPYNLVKNWKAVEIFVRVACIYFGRFLIPMQTVFTQLILFCNVAMIVFAKDLETTSKIVLPMISVTAMLGYSIFLTMAGKVFTSSKATLNSWKLERWSKESQDRKYMKKVRSACQPMSACAGKYFVIRPKSTLNFIRAVSRGTFRSLITFRKVLRK